MKTEDKKIVSMLEHHFQGRGKYINLVGEVYGHDRFPNGTEVTTSSIVRLDFEKGEIETRNTIYKINID